MIERGLSRRTPLGQSPIVLVAASLSLAFLLTASAASAQQPSTGRQSLTGHVLPEFAAAPLVGPLEATTPLQLAIGLPLRNAADLDAFIQDVSDPKSPQYRHFLTPAEFATRFAPTEQDYDSVIAFVQAHGLTVTSRFSNRLAIAVSGSASAVNDAFHVQLTTRRRPDGSTFYAPDREPSVDLDTPLLDVSGLDNYVLPQRGMVETRRPGPPPGDGVVRVLGSGPNGAYAATDFRNAYAPGATVDGSGQAVGLFELDGFYTADINSYVAKFKNELKKTIPVSVVALDHFLSSPEQSGPPQGGCNPKTPLSADTPPPPPAGTPGGENSEVALDIDMAMAMAPGLDHIYVYEGCNTDEILEAMTEPQSGGYPPMQLSASWTFTFTTIGAAAVKAMAATGQTLLVIAGDYHATCPDGNTKSSRALPNVTVVGGTILVMNDDGKTRASEIAATDGGGTLNGVALPSYQTAAAANVGDTSWRAIPDVSMVSCQGASKNPSTKGQCTIFIYDQKGKTNTISGTSVAAPLWAGYLALVNQWRVEHGGGPTGLGFINPTLYSIASNPTQYAADFNDITAGSSPPNPCPTGVGYSAKPNYDLITGLGTPTAQLIQDLGFVPGPVQNPPGPCAGSSVPEVWCPNLHRCAPRSECPLQIAKPPPPL